MEFKPTIFIGSSKEGLKVANPLKQKLSSIAEVTLWPNIFELNKSNLDNLVSQIAFFDYAIIIATADDIIISRNKTFKGPRDNVLFEFGLFMGGLGSARTFMLTEKNTKILSDLSGISLPIIPKSTSKKFDSELENAVEQIKNAIIEKESTFDLSFMPSTTIAYGYFGNFIEKTVQRLLEDKSDKKEFILLNGSKFVISSIKFTVLIPNDLSDDMFNKVTAKRLRDGWLKLKVDPKHVRDYDFSIDVSKASEGELHLVDIPYTLNSLNMAIELYSKKSHLGKTTKEKLLEYREIRNFKRTLEYLINKSSLTRGIVNVEVVDI